MLGERRAAKAVAQSAPTVGPSPHTCSGRVGLAPLPSARQSSPDPRLFPAPLSLARVTIPEQQSVIHGAGRPSSADRRGPYAPVRPYAATGIRGGQYGQINQDPRVSAWLYRRSSTSVRRAVTSLAATSPNPTSPPISP